MSKRLQQVADFAGVDILLLLFLLAGVAFAVKITYNLYFHPLSKYKGPWYLAGSEISLAYLQLRGTSQYTLKHAHDKYGDVVRISPSTLSYIAPGAWNDIYGYRKGTAALPKDPLFYNEMLLSKKTITMASDNDAVPIRRAMNPAFASRNLLKQASMLHGHLERLIEQLRNLSTRCKSDGIDIRKWYTMSMFDVNAEFAFGEDMGCVRNGQYHEWVQFVVDFFFAATLIHQCHKFWPLAPLLAHFMPASVRQNQKSHNEASLKRVQRRMAQDLDRPDFMHHFLHHAQKEGLPMDIIQEQATIVILGGSETSSVGLSAATWHVLNNPPVHEKLRREIRSLFATPAEITLQDTVNKLPYLNAVIWEALRIHAPIANGFTRVVPAWQKEFSICGRHVPPSTVVVINHYCCHTSAENFHEPEKFAPERWLGDAQYAKDRRDAVQPFSVGPRNCPGKNFALNNMKLAMVHMMMSFDMQLCDGMQEWGKGQKIYNGWLQPALQVRLTPVKHVA